MIVREARPEEYDMIGRLTVAAYRALPFEEYTSEFVAYEQQLLAVARRVEHGVTVLVAVDGEGAVVGAVNLVLDDNEYFEHEYGVHGDCGFRMLAVDPSAQGGGAGRMLVHECLARARAAGRTTMVISSTPPMRIAHGMYERLGFVRRPDLDQYWGSTHGMAFALDLSAASDTAE